MQCSLVVFPCVACNHALLDKLMTLLARGRKAIGEVDTLLDVCRDLAQGRTLLFITSVNDDPIAYALTQIVDEEIVVLQVYGVPKKYGVKALQQFIEKWAIAAGLKKMVGYTRRSPKVWEKAYGWKFDSYRIVKELAYGV